MSSTNKTENLNLNQWAGTDRPQRVDFNEDNRLIDEAFTAHINDMSVHTTAADKMQNAAYSYIGDGESTQVLELEFEPDSVIVMPLTHGIVTITNSFVRSYAGANMKDVHTGNLLIEGNRVTVKQLTPSSSEREVPCLNEDGEVYILIALRAAHEE